MWTDEQLNAAKYVAFHDYETKLPLHVGTVEISGANGGVYFTVPSAPFGSLSNESSSVMGMKNATLIPSGCYAVQYTPRGLPVPDRNPSDQYVIHDYGKLVP